MLECQRDRFSLPDGFHYLNCASRAPLLQSAEALGIAGLRRQIAPMSSAADDYYAQSETLRANLASLVNASADQIALTPSVSYGVAIALHNLKIEAGQNVVLPEEEFPSDVYAWMVACERSGATIRRAARPEQMEDIGPRWTQRIVDAIDDQTAAVHLSTVHWTDGVVFDLDAIGHRAREVGAAFILDGTQSIGAMPFDFAAVQPDLLLCAAYKWLLGPYQIGFAAVGPRFIDGEPFEYHWSNRQGSNDVTVTAYHTEYRAGARRFDVGEHANEITLPMLNEGVRQILEWRVPRIADYCRTLTGAIEDGLAGSSIEHAPMADRAPHIIGLRFPQPESLERSVKALEASNVRVSQRGTSLRVSPNVYNNFDDTGALISALG